MSEASRQETRVHAYDASEAAAWNAFVDQAKNGTFLLRRDYMDYHSDRFKDRSLVLKEGDSIVGCFPASEASYGIASHGGLTYGGLLVGKEAKIVDIAHYLGLVCAHYRDKGAKALRYAKVPSFLCAAPSDEDEHCLTAAGARLDRHDVFFVVDRKTASSPDSRRARGAKKAEKQGMDLRLTNDFSIYWNELLCPTLKERHEAKPVHSLEEIELLASRFPGRIRLASAWSEGKMLAGTVLYVSELAVHTQYIASTPEGRQVGALDWLFVKLLKEFETRVRYFSFGTSREPKDGKLNLGLAEWKEGFGARSWGARAYSLDLTSTLSFAP